MALDKASEGRREAVKVSRKFMAIEILALLFPGERGVEEPDTMGKPRRSPYTGSLKFKLPA